MSSASDSPSRASVPRSSIPPDLAPGMCIADRYELSRKLGAGAMGEVWAARHVSLGEEIAIKLVLRDIAHPDGSSTDSRFLLEARVASQLSRKTRHIVSVTDHGTHGSYAYLVMEILNGESLEARLARTGPMQVEKVVPLIHQLARALAVAHADGVVHRDLKPSNVFVTIDEDGKALLKILDFGIAKLRAPMRRGPGAKHTTLRGFLLGTPSFMSPEQARGKAIDQRADVWAITVLAYHLLTGEYPFDGATAEDVLARVTSKPPVRISKWRSDLADQVVELFTRAFAKRIDDRFQTATAFAGALEHAALDRRIAPPRAISLPPVANDVVPAPIAPLPRSPVASVPPDPLVSSIVAAGIPRRRILSTHMLGAISVIGAIGLTASMLSIYFERDVGPRSVTASVVANATNPPPREDDIPPPEPSKTAAAPVLVPDDLPPADSVAPPSKIATPSPPMTTTVTVAPPPRATKPVDRSEVF